MPAIPFEFYRVQGNYSRRAKFPKHGVKFFVVNLLCLHSNSYIDFKTKVFFSTTFAQKCKEIYERDPKSHSRYSISPSPYPLTKDSHNTGNFMPYSFLIVCGFFKVPH